MANYWTLWQRRRLTRRGFLSGAASATVGLLVTALGCGQEKVPREGSPPVSSPAGAQPKRGGTLRVPDNSPPDVFDPAITVHAGSMGQGTTTCLTGLLRYDPQMRIVAHMAELPEVIDKVTYVFKIKPGIRWHDLPPANGREFTAEDAVFGLQRFRAQNPQFIYGASLPIERAEAVDRYTMRITTSRPYVPLLAAVADDWCMMVNREMNDRVGDDGIKRYENLLGTGPWMRGELRQGVGSYLVRNPNYFEPGLPYLDRIEWTIVPDATARWAAFRSKQFDTSVFWGWWVTKQEADQIKSELGDQVYYQIKKGTSFTKIDLHCARPPFNDVRVRQAFHLAVDRQAILAAAGEGNAVLMAAVPQSLPVFAISESELMSLPGYRQNKDGDLAEARRLLDAAGVRNLKVTAITSQAIWGRIAVPVQAALKRIGVDLEFQEAQAVEVLSARARGEFQMVIASTVGSPDPDHYLYGQFHSSSSSNYGKYANSEFDRFAEQQREEFDLARRQALVRQAQEALLRDAPMLFTTSGVAYPTAWSYVRDWTIIPGWNLGWVSARIWLDR